MTLRVASAVLFFSILPVLFRLIQSRRILLRTLLICYLALQLLDAFVLLAFTFHDQVVFWWYVLSSPVRLCLYIVLVRDLYSALFQGYPGIRTVARWSMYGALVIAGLLSFGVVAFTYVSHSATTSKLFYFELAQRTILLALVIFVLMLLLATFRYRMLIPKALIVSSLAFCLLFACEVTVLFYNWQFPNSPAIALNFGLALVSSACYLGWAAMLRPAATPAPTTTSARDAAREERLLSQLTLINATLLRAVKK